NIPSLDNVIRSIRNLFKETFDVILFQINDFSKTVQSEHGKPTTPSRIFVFGARTSSQQSKRWAILVSQFGGQRKPDNKAR
ncbi:hypothetical protein, partial [Sporisorium scitamineum]